jgi:hypothetical protein
MGSIKKIFGYEKNIKTTQKEITDNTEKTDLSK